MYRVQILGNSVTAVVQETSSNCITAVVHGIFSLTAVVHGTFSLTAVVHGTFSLTTVIRGTSSEL